MRKEIENLIPSQTRVNAILMPEDVWKEKI